MNKIDFDQYAEKYEKLISEQLAFFENCDYFAEYKIKIVVENVSKQPNSILEYGCGIGRNLRFIQQAFPRTTIYGCDLSSKSLAVAQRENINTNLFLSTDDVLSKEKFDLVFVAGVFHHIEPEQRLNTLRKIYNYLSESGELFIFEHNPYNPITRHLVNTCPFDCDAILISADQMRSLLIQINFSIKKLRYTLFLPRWLKKLRFLEKYIGFLPCGGQYFIHAKK